MSLQWNGDRNIQVRSSKHIGGLESRNGQQVSASKQASSKQAASKQASSKQAASKQQADGLGKAWQNQVDVWW